MQLSYKAHRLISQAIRDWPAGPNRAQLSQWVDRGHGAELPPHIAALAVRALEDIEHDYTRQI